jgi:hypothetical protein
MLNWSRSFNNLLNPVCRKRQCMRDWEDLRGSPHTLVDSNSNTVKEEELRASSSARGPPDPTRDNPKSPNPSGRRSKREEKGKQLVPSAYLKIDNPFDLNEDEEEEFGDQLFPQ